MNIDNIEEFIVIDKRIDHAEDEAADSIRESIRDRWEFGVLMLAKRKGKQLPNGMLDTLAQATGKSRQELGYRMQFAERFRTDDEVSNALESCTSWRQVIAKLPKPAPPVKGSPPKAAPSKTAPTPAAVEAKARNADEVGPVAITDDGEVMVVDWATMPGTAKAKIMSMRNGLARVYQRQVNERVEKVKAEYLDRLRSERESRFGAIEADLKRRERAVQRANEAFRAKGLITEQEYKTILAVVHPDNSASEERRAEAFRLLRDPKIRVLLVKGAEATGR